MPRLARSLAPLLAVGWLAGCVAPRLVNERCQAPYAELIARYEALGPTTHVVAVRVAGGPALRVALTHVGGGSPEGPVLVGQPGVLAGGDTFRFLAGALGGAHELLLVDPPGTGGSDAPEARTLGPGAYAPDWLAAHTLAALAAWEREQARRPDYVLVGHSLGGAVVLRAVADPALRAEHGDVLARVRGAVLCAPADVVGAERTPQVLDLACLDDCTAGLGERLGLMQKEVRSGVRDNAVVPRRDALRSEALRIEALLGRPATRHAMQAMLKRFQPLLPDGWTPDPAGLAALAQQQRDLRLPMLVVWGRQDRTLRFEKAQPLLERLQDERLVVVERAGHSVHQEAVLDVAAEVRAFVAGLPTSARGR